MKSVNLVKELKKTRANSVFGKKRHYNASDRKRKWHHALTYSVLILNVVTGSVLFGILKADLWEHLPASFALVSALLIGTEEYFKFGKHAAEHHAIGSRYLGLVRDCSRAIALYSDGAIDDAELQRRSGEAQRALTEIDTSAAAYATSDDDYKRSRDGVASGEEHYTDVELNEMG